MKIPHLLAVLLAAAVALPAAAETSAVTATGFVSSFREEVRATPDQAWLAITQLPRWWSSEHTWSGQATNLSVDLAAGGCWCERWGDGQSVQHGRVLLVQPGRVLRFEASLGPLQELAARGVLTLVTAAQEGKTILRMTYRVVGPSDIGMDKLAPVVDQVMAAQYRRLKALAETGKPE
jgi:uncharacterized protein YndB with AHSA1/START domain